MNQFSKKIIDWQKNHGRNNLPWQKKSAYEVWISEIMLQQTQVETVIPYYKAFIKTFPEMLDKRPIVVDENMIVLGGNMRLKACKEAGVKELEIIQVKDWTEEQKQELLNDIDAKLQ